MVNSGECKSKDQNKVTYLTSKQQYEEGGHYFINGNHAAKNWLSVEGLHLDSWKVSKVQGFRGSEKPGSRGINKGAHGHPGTGAQKGNGRW